MRSINVKRLVSAGVGVALLGATAATAFAQVDAGLNKNFFYKDSMEPNAVVVVGADAAVSDAVVAGNIAATIANLAYSEISMPITATGNVDVGEVTVGDPIVSSKAVTISTDSANEVVIDGKTFDATSNSFDTTDKEFDQSKADYNSLKTLNKITDVDYTVDDGSTSVDYVMDVKESIVVDDVDVQFDTDENIQNLRMNIGTNKVVYAVDFSRDGLVDFDDNTDDVTTITIPFLGEEYIVNKSDPTNKIVELVKSKEVNNMTVGQIIDVEGYSLEVQDIESSFGSGSNKVYLTLSQGDTIVAQDVVAAGKDTDFDGKLTGKVRVEEAFAGIIDSNSYISLMLDTESLKLEDGKDFPTNTDWKVDITTSGSKVTAIKIKNSGVSWRSDDTALLMGVEGRTAIDLPNKFAQVIFKGLKQENTEDILVSGNSISFTDGSEDYGISFFATGGSSGRLGLVEGIDGFNYSIVEDDDGDSAYFYINREGESLDKSYDFNETAEGTDVRYGPFNPTEFKDFGDVKLNADSDDTLELTYRLLWLGSDQDSLLVANLISLGDLESDYGATFELTNDLNLTDAYNGDGEYTTGGNKDYNNTGFAYLETSEVDTDVISIYPNLLTISTPTTDYVVKLDVNSGEIIDEDTDLYKDDKSSVEISTSSKDLTYGSTKVLLKDINNFGSIATLESDGSGFNLNFPDKERLAQMAIGMESTTEGGQSKVTLSEGESTVIGGVNVSVSGIDVVVESGAVSGGDATGACVPSVASYTATTVQNVDTLVFLDSQNVRAGNVVLVGGPIVNNLTAEVGSATELGIASAGQKVVVLKGNKLIVAGNTADDTVQAGDELIKWLKSKN